jgi:protein gp37
VSGRSKIEWTDAVWNPVTGCTKVSAGCKNCYAERMATRLAGRAGYPAEHPFAVTLHPERLDEPLHWRQPRRVFVCSTSDLFHPDVPDEFIDDVFAVAAVCPQHTFQALTKRPVRMVRYLSSSAQTFPEAERRDDIAATAFDRFVERPSPSHLGELQFCDSDLLIQPDEWPLTNVWLGTSVEDQATADERIPHLLRCPAPVRFVSYEPALGPVTFADACNDWLNDEGDSLDWIIAGGESGPKARPAHPDWFRSVRDQCAAACVPFFFKQWGEWAPAECLGSTMKFDGMENYHVWDQDNVSRRVGKKAGGHLLDGVEHHQWPKGSA